MTDYTELKRLAEALLAIDDHADFPGWMAASDAFDNATGPAAVLALIAENESVKARLCVCRDCGGQGEVYSGHSSYQGHNQPPEPDMDVCGTCGGDGVLGPVEDFETLAAERDQLKAENEALLSALKGMTSMYGYCWDLVDGCLLCMQENGQRFEYAHEAAQKVIAAMGNGEQS